MFRGTPTLRSILTDLTWSYIPAKFFVDTENEQVLSLKSDGTFQPVRTVTPEILEKAAYRYENETGRRFDRTLAEYHIRRHGLKLTNVTPIYRALYKKG
jgi:hypothetical protein